MPYNFVPDSFHTGVTVKLRAKIDRKSTIFAPTRSLWSKISGTRGRPPPIIFVPLVRPMNALQLCRWQFSQKETLYQTFFKRNAFLMEIGRFAFLRPPLGDLRATYDDRLRLIGKRVVDFLLALIERFSLGVTAEALWAIIGSKSAILLQRGPVDSKFQVEGVASTNRSSFQKTRINMLSYGIKIWTDLSSVLSLCSRVTDRRTDRRTDGQSDRNLLAIPRLHYMQRGKNATYTQTSTRVYTTYKIIKL